MRKDFSGSGQWEGLVGELLGGISEGVRRIGEDKKDSDSFSSK